MLTIRQATSVAEETAPEIVLTLAGDLDLATISVLKAAAAQILIAGVYRIVLDLAGLDFCDAAGLGALVQLQRRCRERQGWIRLARPTDRFRRLLDLAQLGETLPCHATLDQALCHLKEA